MTKKVVGLCIAGILLSCRIAFSQVDTTFVYQTGMPYGTLDIRIAKSSTRYYYLQEGKTFSFRESSPGVKTNTYRDMTSWDSSPYTQGNLREKSGTSDAFIMNYRLLFPGNYNPSYAQGYPLILMVHGLGERGNCWDNDCYWGDRTWRPSTNTPAAPTSSSSALLNNDHNLLHGGDIHLQMRNAAGALLPDDSSLPQRSFPGFVLFPQNLNGWDATSSQDVIKMVRLIIKKYNVDPNRVYIHGLSNGGASVYEMIKRAPWLFSAAAPMSAVSDGGITSQDLTSKVTSVPLWIFQGALDVTPTPAKTEGYIKQFKEAGLSVRYTKYSNLGHGTWNMAYNEPDFFSWLRSKHKSTIHVFADNPTLCETTGEGVKMNLAEGFLAYQWERDGVIIAGATTANYTATTTGTYRARFSRISKTPTEAQWNQWSDPVMIVASHPVLAEVTQTGTVKLKDLNNYNYAQLRSASDADHYYWYKDGVLLNLTGSQDDTTRNVLLKAEDCSSGTCTGNGVYTLVTAGFNNCPSPPSDPIYIFFNNQAPIDITAPATFSGNATSESTATISWTDASSNERGFEIWRRRQTDSTTFTSWIMATLTAPNVNTFNDTGLEPASSYQYKIRAVGDTGRSNYTPSASNQYLIIQTSGDIQNPSVPQNLTATATGIREITLTWQASTDNTGIREYNIYYGSQVIGTVSNVTRYTLANLSLNTNYSFTVRAKDLGGNLSGVSNTATANTYVNGLYYKHTTGAFTDIDLIDWSVAEFKGKVDNFTLAPRTQEDYFNFEFEGYLYINRSGYYQFQTTSDDGSRVMLDNVTVVDNDGVHGNVTISGPVRTLSAGAHFINVKYFENTGGQSLTVRYRGRDTRNAWVVIPNSALRSGTAGSQAPMLPSTGEVLGSSGESELKVSVYPNPSTINETLTVQVDAPGNTEPIQVSLMNLMGKSFYNNTFDVAQANTGATIFPVEKLARGIYVVVVRQRDTVKRKMILVKE